ncbi:MAG TPA: ACT domain-containing protein [Ilumatobacter sp.]|nr:ACT domain-containing protein [Ilumatobacter sp.]
MAGETDLAAMLATLTIERRPDAYTFVTGSEWQALASAAAATIVEVEGPTYVATVTDCRRLGAPVGFEAAWLTVTVHSSLEAVGLTAALSGAMAHAGIACNLLAAFHHDHLLVPWERADEAVAVLAALRSP